MKILLFDISTSVCSIVIADEEKILGEINTYYSANFTQQFWRNLDGLENLLNIKKEEIKKIVVGAGPGSFTGLRVGISAAKSISLSLNAKLFAVSSLDILANKVKDDNRLIFSIIDAKKNEVYFSVYTNRLEENLRRKSVYMVESPENLIGYIKKESILIGSGALTYKDYFLKNSSEKIIIPENENCHFVKSIDLVSLYRQGLTKEVDIQRFEPIYVRKSDAEYNKSG